MKNKLIIITVCFCLLLSANAIARKTAVASAKVAVATENNDAKSEAIAVPDPAAEKIMKPVAPGFQQSNTGNIKTATVSLKNCNGSNNVNRDRPKTDTFGASPTKPLSAQQQNSEPPKVAAGPKVATAE